jgi:hypothetical protein
MTKEEAIEYINTKQAYDLMYSIVHFRNAPNKDNSIALKLIECYRLFLHLEGSKVIIPDCMGCTSGVHPVAELYIYATKNNLFRTSEVVTANQITTEQVEVKYKRKRK